MIGFGSSEGHTISMTFGDDFGAMTAYTIMFWIVLNQSGTAGRDIFGKWSSVVGKEAWIVQMDSTDHINVAHHDGTATVATASTTALTVGTPHHIGITWDGANVRYYLDGVADGSPAFTRAIRSSDAPIYIGARPTSYSVGCAMDIGEITLYENVAEGINTINDHRAGSLRGLDNQVFWFRGLHLDDPEFFGKTTTVASGSPTTVDHQVTTCGFLPHGNFSNSIPMGQIFKVISNDQELVVANEHSDILVQVIDDTQQLQDGDGFNVWDPDGFMEETMSDGTVWKSKFPPFIKRTRWV